LAYRIAGGECPHKDVVARLAMTLIASPCRGCDRGDYPVLCSLVVSPLHSRLSKWKAAQASYRRNRYGRRSAHWGGADLRFLIWINFDLTPQAGMHAWTHRPFVLNLKST
jgi:hypothetical protein